MAVLKITLTEDMLRLVSNFHFLPFSNVVENEGVTNWGLDLNSLYGGNYVAEDVAGILGLQDAEVIEEDYHYGPRYSDEVMTRIMDAHSYVFEHLGEIEEIVHQFILKGGVTAGTYKCRTNEHIWSKE